jgi:hypothetical protein
VRLWDLWDTRHGKISQFPKPHGVSYITHSELPRCKIIGVLCRHPKLDWPRTFFRGEEARAHYQGPT